ncbi:MAG: hypothetical protein IJP11_08035 [Oscillospiraceae bacterium]|nr:hypothetical protein [Oscillospiraceae bacterium]
MRSCLRSRNAIFAEKTAEYLQRLKEICPAWVGQTKQMTEQILNGTHPAFPKQKT